MCIRDSDLTDPFPRICGLKYATKTNIDKENTIIECEAIIDKIEK